MYPLDQFGQFPLLLTRISLPSTGRLAPGKVAVGGSDGATGGFPRLDVPQMVPTKSVLRGSQPS